MAVYIVTEADMPCIIDPCSEIHDVNRYGWPDGKLALDMCIHQLSYMIGLHLRIISENIVGELLWLCEADTSMTKGTVRLTEETLRWCIMQVYIKGIWKEKCHEAERVLRAWPLSYIKWHGGLVRVPVDTRRVDHCATTEHLEVLAREIAGVTLELRQHFIFDDTHGYIPVGADIYHR